MGFSPVVIAFAIVSLLAFVGAVISLYKRSHLFSGYRELRSDAREIARTFNADVYRDGNDLVIAGNMNRLPTNVRFSQEENTPGLFIRMEMPALFRLTIVPQGSSQTGEGRALVRLGDRQFDNKFTIRTDQPSLFRMLLSPKVIADLQKLCCSNKTYLNIERGVMELTELVIPSGAISRHVNDHLQQMAGIAKEMAEMPGAHEIKIKPIEVERNLVARTAIGIGVVAAIATVVVAYNQRRAPVVTALAAETVSGIDPIDARLLPGVQNWRLANPTDDFDPTGLTWAQNNNLKLAGRMTADFSGTGDGRDEVYVLRRPSNGAFRVAIFSRGEKRYDTTYDKLAVVAPFPKSLVDSIQWGSAPPDRPDGDGLLIAYDPGNPANVVVIFLKGDRIISSQPAHYQNIQY